jgi:hypothetical protein
MKINDYISVLNKSIYIIFTMVSCSFCGSKTHKVGCCTNPRLTLVYNQLSIIYLSSANRETIFANVVNREYKANELKAVCLNKLSLKTSSKMKAINGLYMHFITAMAGLPAMIYEPAMQYTHPLQYAQILSSDPVDLSSAPDLPLKRQNTILPIYDLSDETEEDVAEECAICFDNINSSERVVLNCEHQFCVTCINDYIKSIISNKN